MSATDSLGLVEAADPALVYLIFTWLRKRYADHLNSDAVIRTSLSAFSGAHSDIGHPEVAWAAVSAAGVGH